jgi:hypothetical protein
MAAAMGRRRGKSKNTGVRAVKTLGQVPGCRRRIRGAAAQSVRSGQGNVGARARGSAARRLRARAARGGAPAGRGGRATGRRGSRVSGAPLGCEVLV